jgi:Fe-S-cluster containining protein
MSLQYDLSYIKTHYRKIFREKQDLLFSKLETLRDKYQCPDCDAPPGLLDAMHPDCGYREWLQEAVAAIETEDARSVFMQVQEIQARKRDYTCHQCGVCCRLASSEYSFEELQERAENGDDFARQFTSVFLPYASAEAARQKFPEIVSAVLEETRLMSGEQGNTADHQPVYFYHCPYVGEDNRCTLYGTAKRPAICEEYPGTPLTFIYDQCAWRPWKDKFHQASLAAHAEIELCSWLVNRLKSALY